MMDVIGESPWKDARASPQGIVTNQQRTVTGQQNTVTFRYGTVTAERGSGSRPCHSPFVHVVGNGTSTVGADGDATSDVEAAVICIDASRTKVQCVENSVSEQLTNSTSSSTIKTDDDDVESSEQIPEERKLSFRNMTREQKVVLACTNATNLITYLSLSILAPFFPTEANKKNVSDTVSGWIFGVFALATFLFSPLFGKLVPVVGTRFMYIAGLFVCGGCTLLFGVLDLIDTTESAVTFVALCFTVRVFLALGCTGVNTAGFVLLVRYFPNDVATAFGIGEVFVGIGMVTGPAVGGFLYALGGFMLPFAVIGGTCLSILPLVWCFLPVQDDGTVDPEQVPLTIWTLLKVPKAAVNSVAVFVGASIWSVLDPTLEPHLRVFQLAPEMIGILFLIMAAVYAISSPLWGWMADKVRDNRSMLIPGFLLSGVGLMLVGPSELLGFSQTFNELWMNVISLVVIGIANSLCIIPTYDLYITVLNDLGYPEDTSALGVVSSLWVAMYALGDFAGPSAGGFLNDQVGFEWLCTYVALVCCSTSLLVAVSWFIEAKCCKKKVSTKPLTNGVLGETTPLLRDVPDEDILKSYPPRLQDSYS